mmetsp:Transcript_9519/g.28770  ORF Transcript_9519/g.28770 Transcript_9519/m.28770 type:complete len:205 (-) Transcript_9519:2623-3237(-)
MEYRNMYLRAAREAAAAARPSFTALATDRIVVIREVSGAASDAVTSPSSSLHRDTPTVASRRAPASFAPSPHMPTKHLSSCLRRRTSSVLSAADILANTEHLRSTLEKSTILWSLLPLAESTLNSAARTRKAPPTTTRSRDECGLSPSRRILSTTSARFSLRFPEAFISVKTTSTLLLPGNGARHFCVSHMMTGRFLAAGTIPH